MFNPKDSLFQIKFYRACPPFFEIFKGCGLCDSLFTEEKFWEKPSPCICDGKGKEERQLIKVNFKTAHGRREAGMMSEEDSVMQRINLGCPAYGLVQK